MVLESDLWKLLELFTYNGMTVNSNKFQLMFLGIKWKQKLRIHVDGDKILAKKHVKLLGVEIGNKLKFDRHAETLLQKFKKKTSAFARLNIYISREQALWIFNVVILSDFNYCPLIQLFCNKSANKKIDQANKHALRAFYIDYDSTFQSLLRRSNSYTIHVQNLQKLIIEIYNSLDNMNLSIVLEFYEEKGVKYDLGKKNLCKLQKVKTTSYGVESVS